MLLSIQLGRGGSLWDRSARSWRTNSFIVQKSHGLKQLLQDFGFGVFFPLSPVWVCGFFYRLFFAACFHVFFPPFFFPWGESSGLIYQMRNSEQGRGESVFCQQGKKAVLREVEIFPLFISSSSISTHLLKRQSNGKFYADVLKYLIHLHYTSRERMLPAKMPADDTAETKTSGQWPFVGATKNFSLPPKIRGWGCW